MKKSLQAMLGSLKEDRQNILDIQEKLDKQLRALCVTRQETARNLVNKILPDLSPETITKLRGKVPEFPIPIRRSFFDGIRRFFGGSPVEKIDPEVTLDILRMKLGAYLDGVSAEKHPNFWIERVGKINNAIHDFQTNPIKINNERLAEISARIKAIQKLQAVHTKIDPTMQRKIEAAIKTRTDNVRLGKKHARVSPLNSKTPPAYPTHEQRSSESGPGLLEAWLWYELLSSHSDYSHETRNFDFSKEAFGGGSSGGAGVERSIPEGIAVHADSGDINVQNELGAGAFS